MPVFCVLACCKHIARKVPINYILLLAFTVCESYMVAFICAFYTAESVMVAAAMTAGLTITLTAYAMCTKTDFTVCGGALCVIAFSVMSLMFVSIFVPFPSWWHPVLSCVLIVMYGFFLLYDTQ